MYNYGLKFLRNDLLNCNHEFMPTYNLHKSANHDGS